MQQTWLSMWLSTSVCCKDHNAFPDAPPTAQVDKFVAKAYAFLCSEDALDLGKVDGGGWKE